VYKSPQEFLVFPLFSRRQFLAFASGALFAPPTLFGKDEVPSLLDHILLGCKDLEAAIDFVESRTGVRAALGGVHPGRGTQNALLSLGERKYLEIIAPDPAQPESKNPLAQHLHSLSEAALVGWAAHPGELVSFAKRLREAGIVFEGPTPGSRRRPDGRLLQWKTLNLEDGASGLLPFFIEWSVDSPHPSSDAPAGMRLVRFELATPQPETLAKKAALLTLDAPIAKADRPHLHASLAGPKGNLDLTS
jgi:catechol 2,3-dioxygenase-like lactoylglutathione lyase family enzyme